MDTIKVSENELSGLQKLGEGACGTVYKYNDDIAIKVLKKTGMQLHNDAAFSELLGLENGTCIFPSCRLEIDGEFQGCAMKYVKGRKLSEVVKQLDFDTFLNAITKAEGDIKALSKDKVMADEVNHGSLMWTSDNQIAMLDTDGFFRNEALTDAEIDGHNLQQFNSLIEMVTGILEGPLNRYLNSRDVCSQMFIEYNRAAIEGNNMSVTVLLEKIREEFSKEFGIMPHSIEEMENVLIEKGIYVPPDPVTEAPTFYPPSIDEGSASFSEIEIGKGTINILSPLKKEAGDKVKRDGQSLEMDLSK